MGKLIPQREWLLRDDGTCWRPVEINGAPGIAVVVKDANGRYSVTMVCELLGTTTSLEEAKTKLDQWLRSGGMFAAIASIKASATAWASNFA